MKVRWTNEALDRLVEIEDFIAQDNPRRARRFVTALIEEGESLSKNARRGRIVPETSSPDIRELVVKNYRIVYRLQPGRIEILTVFEGHRQLRSDQVEE